MRRLILTAAVLAAFAAGHASAASFDCRKAATPDEKTICNYRTLDNYDVQMAVLYNVDAKLMMMGARGDMQDDQRAWLADRHKCNDNVQCLIRSYQTRIYQLQTAFNSIASRGPF